MNHRNAKFYDLRIKSECRYKVGEKIVSNNVPPQSLESISQQIADIHAEGKFQRESKGVCFYLADYQLDTNNQTLLLLINKSDSTEPDPTISNPTTKDRRTLKKPDGYGNDYSAHVLISLKPLEIDKNIYPLVYESVRGSSIYGTHIRIFINMMLRICRESNPEKYLTEHPAGVMTDKGKPLMLNSLHMCELSGKISEDFEKDLASGQLETIELIDYDNQNKVWDDSDCISEQKRVIELTAKKQPQNNLNSILTVFQKAKNESYEQARIRFRDNRGAPQTVSLFTDDLSLVDDSKYVKKTQIKVKTNDKFGFEKIHDEIKNELYKLL